MKIQISSLQTIGEVKRIFNSEFPFLHLEFFSGTTEKGFPNPLQKIVDDKKQINGIRSTKQEGELSFTGNDKVSIIEKTFQEKFGLTVQVFRKSGNQWLITTTTDELSLNEQNKLGEEMSFAVGTIEPDDIHEQE